MHVVLQQASANGEEKKGITLLSTFCIPGPTNKKKNKKKKKKKIKDMSS